MRHVFECAVRFDDLDSYGHVNNVTFAEYLQEARIDFAHRHLAGALEPHEGAVVAHQSIDYVLPVPFRTEPIRVEVWVTRIGTIAHVRPVPWWRTTWSYRSPARSARRSVPP